MYLAAGEAADGDDHLNSFVQYRLGIPQIGQGVPFLSDLDTRKESCVFEVDFDVNISRSGIQCGNNSAQATNFVSPMSIRGVTISIRHTIRDQDSQKVPQWLLEYQYFNRPY